MFSVGNKCWWQKPEYFVPLAGCVVTGMALITGAYIQRPIPPEPHETFRPISPPQPQVIRAEKICGRRPYIDDPPAHATYRLLIRNPSEKTVTIKEARLNISVIGYQPKPYPRSSLKWHGCGDRNYNSATVCIPAGAKEGQSIRFEVNVELSPGATQEMYLFVCRHHPQGKRDECFLAYGAVTFYPVNAGEFTTQGLYFAGEKNDSSAESVGRF